MASERVTAEEALDAVIGTLSKGGGDGKKRQRLSARVLAFIAQTAEVERVAREVLADIDGRRWLEGAPSAKTVKALRAALTLPGEG
jgi:hypothetical protein